MNTSIQGRQKQSGMAIIEFTIALPLMLILFVGTAEVGRLLYDYNTLTKAQRTGARHLATHAETGNTDIYVVSGSQYATEATNLVVFGTIDGSGTPLLPNLSAANVTLDDPTQNEVRVTVSYNYVPMIFTTLPGFGVVSDIPLGLTLSSSVTMRALRGG